MKKKNIIIVIIFILAITLIIYLLQKKSFDVDGHKIEKIEYTYGGGFGTIATTANKKIIFNSNGEVLLTNDYNSITKTIQIGTNKYNELVNYINDRISLFKERAKENNNVSDGTTSYLKITLDDNTTYEIGGYMISNKKFTEIRNKIYEVIDKNELNNYIKSIEE